MSLQSLRTGVSGLNANQTRLDVISNNISNSSTVAFKEGRAAFSEVLGQEILGVGRSSGSGVNPSKVGRGVSVASVDRNFSQGSLDQTGIKSDLALSGDGFFIASPNEGAGSQQRRLTRAGDFTFNQNGELVTNGGLNVQGWKVNDQGEVQTGELQNIQFDPNAQSAAKFTSESEVGGNLSADTEVGDTSSISTVVYDGKGEAHNVVVEFEKTADKQWDYRIKSAGNDSFNMNTDNDNDLTTGTSKGTAEIYTDANTGEIITDSDGNALTVESEDGNPPSDAVDNNGNVSTTTIYEGFQTGEGKVVLDDDLADNGGAGTDDVVLDGENVPEGTSATTISYIEGRINFNTDGSVETIEQDVGSDGNFVDVTDQNGPSISWQETFVDGGESMSLDFSGITQYSGSTTSKFQSQNGHTSGELADFSFTQEGKLKLNYTNGEQEEIYQLAIGNVNNPNGLEQQGENFYTTTSASGDLQLGRAGRDLQTSVVSGSLESSNVDLSQEFADLIEAQRSYQASSRVVTTADQVLQETVQLKR